MGAIDGMSRLLGEVSADVKNVVNRLEQGDSRMDRIEVNIAVLSAQMADLKAKGCFRGEEDRKAIDEVKGQTKKIIGYIVLTAFSTGVASTGGVELIKMLIGM